MGRSSSRDTTALVVGSAVSGLLAYVLFAATTRILGPEQAAPVSVLWSYWSFAGAAFTFPLQHWIARSVTAHGEGAVRRSLPRVGSAMVGASLALGGLAWVGREPLFHREDAWFPVLVGLVTLGSASIGVVRGGLGARHRFVGLAWSLVAENGVRCVAVGVLAVAGVTSAVGYGLALVVGHLVAFAWVREARFGTERTAGARGPVGFLTGAGLGQLLGQIVLTGGPVVLALAGGSPAEVTALFAALALFRAPYILALGAVSQLTTKVTGLVVAGEAAALRRIHQVVVLATAGSVAVAGAGAAWLGPGLLRLVFGPEVDFGRGEAAVVGAASTLAVANLVIMISALARDRPGAVAGSWVLALVTAALGFIALPALTPADRAVGCFLLAELVAFVALTVAAVRRTGPAA